MRSTLAMVALGGLLLVACGGDEQTPTGTEAETGAASQGEGEAPVQLGGDVNDHGTGQVEGDVVEMEADDFYFQPTFVEAAAGTTVTVRLHNEGDAGHTFTIDEQDVDVVLDPGAEAETEVDVGNGALRFYCRFHESQGMQGAFFTAAGQKAASGPVDGRSSG
ncbi:MAG TPA: cupredoxin domain-containing protein [Nitriliruptorales bacterium]|nr:cupredoxin domain-containing protein [Nitriliruptorales bacterium]